MNEKSRKRTGLENIKGTRMKAQEGKKEWERKRLNKIGMKRKRMKEKRNEGE